MTHKTYELFHSIPLPWQVIIIEKELFLNELLKIVVNKSIIVLTST